MRHRHGTESAVLSDGSRLRPTECDAVLTSYLASVIPN